jgi:hypothetical protein
MSTLRQLVKEARDMETMARGPMPAISAKEPRSVGGRRATHYVQDLKGYMGFGDSVTCKGVTGHFHPEKAEGGTGKAYGTAFPELVGMSWYTGLVILLLPVRTFQDYVTDHARRRGEVQQRRPIGLQRNPD